MLQLPALEDCCVAINRSLGTAQSTATCRPVNETRTCPNYFPQWASQQSKCFLTSKTNVKCLTLTFDLFQVQSIERSPCPTHVFKLDKCKSSHLPICIHIKKHTKITNQRSHTNLIVCTSWKVKSISYQVWGEFWSQELFQTWHKAAWDHPQSTVTQEMSRATGKSSKYHLNREYVTEDQNVLVIHRVS